MVRSAFVSQLLAGVLCINSHINKLIYLMADQSFYLVIHSSRHVNTLVLIFVGQIVLSTVLAVTSNIIEKAILMNFSSDFKSARVRNLQPLSLWALLHRLRAASREKCTNVNQWYKKSLLSVSFSSSIKFSFSHPFYFLSFTTIHPSGSSWH